MSFYKPTFLSPDSISIDKSNDNIFSWQSNGDEPQVAFQLFIYKNSDNTLVYDSTKITSSVSQHTVLANTLANGVDYKWKVNVYKDSTNYLSSNYIFFQANTTPTLSIDSFPNPLTTQNYTFSATYNQSENIPIKKFVFYLYDVSGNVVYNSGDIYSATPTHEITGMTNNSSFEIECEATNQNEVSIKSSKVSFSTLYDVPIDIPTLSVLSLNDIGAIKLMWDNMQQVLGIATGTYSYVSGKFNLGISLDNGSYVTYNEIITSDFTTTFWVKLASGFVGDIIIFGNNEFVVGYDGNHFYWKNDYRITASQTRSLPSNYFLIGVKQDKIIIVTDSYIETIV